MAVSTIIIPHRRRPSNDKALMLALQSVLDNSVYDHEIIVDLTYPKDPYRIWNETALNVQTPAIVFSNSDVVFAPEWDKHMIEQTLPNRIVTGYIVEPGNIGVAGVNITRDFGKHPDNFQRAEFEKFAKKHGAQKPAWKKERGWYMPCAMNRIWFLGTGGFPMEKPFPEPNDIAFWERCKKEYGTDFIRVNSYSYHFQNQSARE